MSLCTRCAACNQDSEWIRWYTLRAVNITVAACKRFVTSVEPDNNLDENRSLCDLPVELTFNIGQNLGTYNVSCHSYLLWWSLAKLSQSEYVKFVLGRGSWKQHLRLR